MSKPTIKDLQQKLNMANKTVAELMKANDELQRRDKLNNEQYRLLNEQKDKLKTAKDIADNGLLECAKELAWYVEENAQLNKDLGKLRCLLGETLESKSCYESENAKLKDDLVNANSDIEKLIKSVNEVTDENYKLKNEVGDFQRRFELNNKQFLLIREENQELKNCYDGIREEYNKLFEESKNINAENYALKAEIERTNRHINLAENALHEKEQPIVYNNCTFYNK